MTMPNVTTADDSPATPSPAYQRMRPRWKLCRDVRGGTPTVRANATDYLPRFEAEEHRDWEARVNLTTVFDALEQTIGTMVGLAGGTDPVLEKDVPPKLAAMWEDLDGEGTHGAVFAMECLDKALEVGHNIIWVDAPAKSPGLTVEQEAASGFRPYFIRLDVEQVKNWRVAKRGGHRYLAQVTIEQVFSRAKGNFGHETVTQHRVFRQQFTDSGTPYAQWELWETQGESKSVQVVPPTTIDGPKWIPIAVNYGGERIDILESRPPLLGLAYTNVRHTQVESDFASYLHLCGKPTPVFIGRDTSTSPDVVMGHAVDVALGGDAKLLELSGHSLDTMRETKKDLELQMVAQGLSMLQRDVQTAETATASRMNKVREDSKLARAVRSLQDALEASLGFAAAYLGERDGGSVTIRRDFGTLVLSDAELALLGGIRERGDLSLETFLGFLRSKGGVFEELDPAEEVERLHREQAVEEGAGAL